MGFFSELKSDLSQAVNTLMPEDKPELSEGLDNDKAESRKDTKPVDLGSMLERLDDIKLDEADSAEKTEEKIQEEEQADEPEVNEPEAVEPEKEPEPEPAPAEDELEAKIEEQTEAEIEAKEEEPKSALEAINPAHIDKYVANKNAETRYKILDQLLANRYHNYTTEDLR